MVLSGFTFLKKFIRCGDYYRKVALFTRFKSLLFFMFSDKGEFYFKAGIKAVFINLLLLTGLPSIYVIYYQRIRDVKKALKGYKREYEWVDHHKGHAFSSYYTSGFDKCLSVVIEGLDWEDSMVIDEIKDGKIRRLCSTPWPHSAGYFYELITMLLGFNLYVHAGKITGLAAYGDPGNAWKQVERLMWVEGMELRVNPLIYTLRYEYAKNKQIPDYFSGYTPEDLAAAFQERLEECVIDILKKVLSVTGPSNVILSGGVSANVKINQKIHELDCVKDVFVHPAMSDAGQALGVALWAAAENGDMDGALTLSNVFLGPEYSENEIEQELLSAGVEYRKTKHISYEVAKLLNDGYVVARFTGRVEYGPRALGNRSILCKPTDPSINDWLNERLKRTEFMPFAPANLIEDSEKLYLNIKGAEYTAKFMTITFSCTDMMKQSCPAVVHVDGTARPQFVDREGNPGLYEIIKEYKKMTGIPAIINTSFNVHGEPIVLTPNDALSSFLEGSLDFLAIGKFIVPHPGMMADRV